MSKTGRLFLRTIICLLGSLLFTLVIEYLLSEILIHWYMWSNGVEVRSDLSEDMGVGMLGFFQFMISAPIFFIAIFWYFLKKTARFSSQNQAE